MDDDTTLLLLNDAKLRNDLLTKQLTTQRAVIAELYEERDAAWAALVDYAEALKKHSTGSSIDLGGRHRATVMAARAGVKPDDK